jgi:integrase
MVGYYTGMRSGEILSLTWNKVDLKARCIYLIASDTKDKEPRAIPICNDLYQTVHTIPRAIHDTHVFLYRGRPIKDFEKALATACDKAGIIYGKNISGGFIFHDLRHTFNTYMRKAGVAESIIMKITGHSTRQMFDRYNTIDAEDTTKGINQMEAFLQSSDQNSDQTLKNKS